MQWYLQILDFSKIKRCENFSSSAIKKQFIFYCQFSLQLTENLSKQKHFLETWYLRFAYNIFLYKVYNKKNVWSNNSLNQKALTHIIYHNDICPTIYIKILYCFLPFSSNSIHS